MKTHRTHRPFMPSSLTLACLALAAQPAFAVTYYWDNNDVTGGFGTAGGTWTAPTASQWSTDSTGVAAPGASVTTTTSDALNFGTATDGLAAGTITVSGTVSANTLTFGSASGAIALSGGIITLGGPTITVNNASDTISSVIAGTAGLTKGGAGTLTLSNANTFTGPMTVSGGTLTLDSTGSINTAAGQINVSAAAGATLNVAGGSLTTTFNTASRGIRLGTATGQTGTINVSGGTASVTTPSLYIAEDGGGNGVFSQSGGTVAVGGSNVWMAGHTSTLTVSGGTFTINSGGGNMYLGFGTGGISTSTVNVNGTASVTLGIIQFGQSGRNGFTANVNVGNGSAGGTLQVNNITWGGATSAGSTINFNGGTLAANASFSIPTQIATVVQSGGANISVLAGASTLTIPTALTDGGGGGGLTKTGPGTLTLSNAGNAYTGATAVSAGTIKLGAANVIPDGAGKGNVSVTGTLDLNTFSETINGLSGTGTVETVAGGTPTLTVGGNDATSTFNGLIKGTLALTKTGTGTLTLQPPSGTGKASPTGSITVNDGILHFDLGSAGPDRDFSKTLIVNGASTLRFSGLGGQRQLFQNSAFSYGAAGGGQITIDSINPILNGSTVTTTGGAQNTFTGTSSLNCQGNNLTFDVAPGTDPAGLDFTGYAGNLKLIKSGTGVMTISSTSNPTSAGVQINAGTLEIASGGRLASGNYAGAILNNASFRYNSTASQTLSGAISGTGVLVKANSGTLTLAGANNYSGDTSVQGGALIINGTHSGGGLITVSASATLGGGGQVGDVALSSAGILSPGSEDRGDNWLQVANLSLGDAASPLNFELGNPDDGLASLLENDLILAASIPLLRGVLNVTPLPGFASAPPGSKWRLFDNSSGGTPGAHELTMGLGISTGYAIQAYQGDNSVYLVAVPEAASSGLLLVGLLLLFLRRK